MTTSQRKVATEDKQRTHRTVGMLRRFDDNRPDHWSNIAIDEGDGSRRLRSGAFTWNPDLSVALTSALDSLGIPYADVASKPYLGLAFAVVAEVEAFRSGNTKSADSPEFGVIADPQEPPPDWIAAHGLVQQLGEYASKQRARDARRELGRRAFTPVMLTSGILPQWQQHIGN